MNSEMINAIIGILGDIQKNQVAIMRAMVIHARYLTVRDELVAVLQERLDCYDEKK